MPLPTLTKPHPVNQQTPIQINNSQQQKDEKSRSQVIDLDPNPWHFGHRYELNRSYELPEDIEDPQSVSDQEWYRQERLLWTSDGKTEESVALCWQKQADSRTHQHLDRHHG